MNNKRVEKLIPKAIKYLENNEKFKHKDGIDKVYSGYISSFGSSVLMSGILKSVTFYSGDEKKKKVIQIFFDILKDSQEITTDCSRLLDYLQADNNYKNIMVKNKVLDAVVASKLAIGTFKLEE